MGLESEASRIFSEYQLRQAAVTDEEREKDAHRRNETAKTNLRQMQGIAFDSPYANSSAAALANEFIHKHKR